MCKPAGAALLGEKLRSSSFRQELGLYGGCAFNWLFAIFRIFTSLVFASAWDGALAVYYIVLGMMRVILIQNKREADQIRYPNEKLLHEYYGYRQCGCMMLALNVCAAGIIVQIIRHGQSAVYPKGILGVYAVYALVMLNLAFFNLLRYKKCHSPNGSAAKVVSFSMAFMAILSLQTAIIAQFDTEAQHAMGLKISLSSIICLTLFGMALFMLVKANRQIRRLRELVPRPLGAPRRRLAR